MQTEAHEALSADIHLLGGLLGEAIRRLAGEEAFDLVEEVRALGQGAAGRPVGGGGAAAPRPPRQLDLPASCGP